MTQTSADSNFVLGVHHDYLIKSSGEIEISSKVISRGTVPEWLPKLGLALAMPEEFQTLKWYGRGPFETYPDRKTGARTGIYTSLAGETYVPYMIPQDHGNRTDVRWLEISNGNGKGWLIQGSDLFNFSCHQFSPDNLERAMYPFQLEKSDQVYLNLDAYVSGVGETAKSTLQQYRILPGVYEFSFRIKPL
jgi:beta-galactosidase